MTGAYGQGSVTDAFFKGFFSRGGERIVMISKGDQEMFVHEADDTYTYKGVQMIPGDGFIHGNTLHKLQDQLGEYAGTYQLIFKDIDLEELDSLPNLDAYSDMEGIGFKQAHLPQVDWAKDIPFTQLNSDNSSYHCHRPSATTSLQTHVGTSQVTANAPSCVALESTSNKTESEDEPDHYTATDGEQRTPQGSDNEVE